MKNIGKYFLIALLSVIIFLFGFDFKDCFFRPTKIDIEKKLLNFA